MGFTNTSKLKYYIKLAIKKPYLILRFIFTRHIGAIFILPIKSSLNQTENRNIESIELTSDVDEIYNFYKSVGRDSMSRIQIQKWLNSKFDCFLVRGRDSIPIAGMWILKDKFKLKNTSGMTLSSESEIRLDNDTVYGAYVIVDEKHRGIGVNQSLLSFVIEYYSANSHFKKVLLITGASNGA